MNCSACCSSDSGLGGQGNPGITVNLSQRTHHPQDGALSACLLVTVGLVVRLWLWKGERLPLLGRCSHPFWQAARHQGVSCEADMVLEKQCEFLHKWGNLLWSTCATQQWNEEFQNFFWFIETHKSQNASCSFQNSPLTRYVTYSKDTVISQVTHGHLFGELSEKPTFAAY